MRRREFITLLGGTAAAWPLAARAQQPAVPVVGWLSGRWPEVEPLLTAAFRKGLAETGFVEGRNVAIESHWAYGQVDRLPALAADLVRRQVAVIVAAGVGIKEVRRLTPAIPIVFSTPTDPVQAGYVASLTRPTGNMTGVSNLGIEAGPKRLELLHELAPQTTSIAVLGDPNVGEIPSQATQAAARALGLTLHALHASNERDIDDAFTALPRLGAGALHVETSPLFTSRVKQIAELALRYKMPAAYQNREFALAGGLASYSGSLTEGCRLAGIYVGRILKGERPADLPVQLVTKVELVINLKPMAKRNARRVMFHRFSPSLGTTYTRLSRSESTRSRPIGLRLTCTALRPWRGCGRIRRVDSTTMDGSPRCLMW
jgi:putative ABC transport system substrate-binding protein